MTPQRLDHVALRVTDRDAVAEALLCRLPFRVLERSEELLLLGRSPDLGKVTLLEGPGPRERGALVAIGIGIPCGTARTSFEVDDGLVVVFVPSDRDGEVELEELALRVPDPASSAREWERFGFERAGRVGVVERLALGQALVELHPGRPEPTDRPLLDHVGLLVSSFDDALRSADRIGLDVTREVDAENSRALFVRGPNGVSVEYVEHKPSFAFASTS